jgi:hypothetical protein
MRPHIKALGALHIILAIIYFSFGIMGLFLFGGWPSITGDEPVPSYTIPLFGSAAGFGWLAVTLYSVPELLIAIPFLMLKTWSRPLMLVLSVLSLPFLPVNTLLGFYGLYIVNEQETKNLFRR